MESFFSTDELLLSPIQVDPKKDVVLDVSSTSSEESDHETPLTQLQAQELMAKVTETKAGTVCSLIQSVEELA